MAGIDEMEALLCFSLAPLRTRRDIAMLGVIHRTVLGKGPAQLQQFFCRKAKEGVARTRLQARRHDCQLVEYCDGHHTELIRRSVLGLISVYNLLPQHAVQATSVSLFHSCLQSLVQERALGGDEAWRDLLSPRHNRW